ncbi:hypothetical protein [Sporolactobacillus putidus]|uniref:DUF2178 domain-containing protein n=1 Tax=Sporolactobacillus putidus TaxID=492735 RepID=A0A917W5M6_9BACL|nr:hypothetical protein [Sporolactobacillus putidus]GGL65208.1 hypothetical protein GCM10007968_31520 [Sporolactobacillus putidus]
MRGIHYITSTIGLLLLGIGFYLVKTVIEPQGMMKTLPYMCVGLGCGFFGQGMGEIVRRRALKNYPDIRKQIEIDRHDERNTAIGNRAKAKAYDLMKFTFGALMIAFALMGIDLAAVLLLAFAYLFVLGYGIYYRCKYDKEM